MRNRFTSALAAFVMLLGTMVAASPAAPAQAAPVQAKAAITSCQTLIPQAALCLYAYTNHQNMIDFWNSNEPRNTCFPIERPTEDNFRADSYDNNTRYRWRLFRTTRCDGSHMSAPPFTSPVSLPDGWINAVVAVSRTSSTE